MKERRRAMGTDAEGIFLSASYVTGIETRGEQDLSG